MLTIAAETAREWPRLGRAADAPRALLVAGACGRTQQARAEARLARGLGYDAVLLSLAALKGASEDELVAHCAAVAGELPLIGFYLQPAVGGVELPASFWARFAALDNVVAIKVAPFNRYRTLDVVRGLVAARARGSRRALYRQRRSHRPRPGRRRSTSSATARRCGCAFAAACSATGRCGRRARSPCSSAARRARRRRTRAARCDVELLALDSRVTDCNSAFFDVANDFHGCIAGCHEVLRRQGLLEGTWCLDPGEGMSPGQREAIDRVCREHADLSDDAFVAANLQRWLA